MKSKFFLRGLGTGIVLATLVCLIAFNVDRSKAALEEKSTKEQTTIFDEKSSDEKSPFKIVRIPSLAISFFSKEPFNK